MSQYRKGQYKLGSTSTPDPLCDILHEREDPLSDFQEFTTVVGSDLTGAPIEAGLPTATWHWPRLSQTDYNLLVGLIGNVYLRTRNNVGGGATTYGDYSAVMARPQGTYEYGEWTNVSVNFVEMILIP